MALSSGSGGIGGVVAYSGGPSGGGGQTGQVRDHICCGVCAPGSATDYSHTEVRPGELVTVTAPDVGVQDAIEEQRRS